MNAETAKSVAEYLIGLGNCSEVYPIRVTFGLKKSKEYYGAKYTDSNGNCRYYLLGDRPKFKKESTCFRQLCNYTDDWFVAGWADKRTTSDPVFAAYHPFGAWFGVHKWTAPGKIDDGEKPYDRVLMAVEKLG